MDTIGEKIQVKNGDLSTWYNINISTLERLGCLPLLARYGKSYITMLQKIYPEHEWQVWRFKHLRLRSPEGKQAVSDALSFIERECGIRDKDGWYAVTPERLTELGVSSFITKAGGLWKVLKDHRPGIEFNLGKIS